MHQGSTTADMNMGGTSQDRHEDGHGRRCGAKGRRRWSFLEMAVVVGSFIVFWPLGIAALVLKLVKGELWSGASEMAPPWQKWRENEAYGFAKNWSQDWSKGRGQWQPSSGNAAFDAYRREQLEKLEAERRKLDDERKAFAEHLSKLRQAKDQEEFERFMRERQPPASSTVTE
jgi:Protein of unknown function (DUF2852)